VRFDLKYSTNNGTSWKPVATGVTGSSYDWTVPALPNNSSSCRVLITAYDTSNKKAGTAVSARPFAIAVVKLDTPNGGEDLASGSVSTTLWTTNATLRPVAKVKLQYSLTGGAAWKTITTLAGNAGSYSWSVPTVTSSKPRCMVRVVLQDAAGRGLGKDASDASFTIHP